MLSEQKEPKRVSICTVRSHQWVCDLLLGAASYIPPSRAPPRGS